MAYSDASEAVFVFETIMTAGAVTAFVALACAIFKKKGQRSKAGLALSIIGVLPAIWLLFTEHESLGAGQLDGIDILFLSALPVAATAFFISARTSPTKNENGA
jgi:hypothetical protein